MSKKLTKSDEEILKWVVWKMQQEIDYQQGIVNGSAPFLKKGIAQEVIYRLQLPLNDFKDMLAGKFERPIAGGPMIYSESEMVVCGIYGCKNKKPKRHSFCTSCEKEFHEDPEAFK